MNLHSCNYQQTLPYKTTMTDWVAEKAVKVSMYGIVNWPTESRIKHNLEYNNK